MRLSNTINNYCPTKTSAAAAAAGGCVAYRQNCFSTTTTSLSSAMGRKMSSSSSTVQSIGQFIQKQMDNSNNNNNNGSLADENRHCLGDNERQQRHGTVQLVDPNNNAGEQRKFVGGCSWKDTFFCDNVAYGCADAVEEQNEFRCCAVCEGRIWQNAGGNAKRSPILADQQQHLLMKLDGVEQELLVHSACFRCATCGLDLLGEEAEEQVVKHADRFYCSLHGQQQTQKLQQEQQQQQQKHVYQDGHDTFNGMVPKVQQLSTAAATTGGDNDNRKTSNFLSGANNNRGKKSSSSCWKNRTNMATTVGAEQRQQNMDHRRSNSYGEKSNNIDEKKSNNIEEKKSNNTIIDHAEHDGDEHHLLQKWWERKAEEFNGGKGSTTFRYDRNSTNGQQHKLGPNVVKMPPPPVPPKVSSSVGRRQMETKSNGQKNTNDKDGTHKCEQCGIELSGSFVLAKDRCWCPEHFVCANSACARRLLESGFVEEPQGRKNYCPVCYECLMAPVCRNCFLPLTETCLNALGEKWHNECFTCTHCRKPFGTLSFFVEDGKPYCEDDWNLIFTTKCADCLKPIKVGQKWLEAIGGQQFHADCFKCANCGIGLEGKTYFERDQQPFCRVHATVAASSAVIGM